MAKQGIFPPCQLKTPKTSLSNYTPLPKTTIRKMIIIITKKQKGLDIENK